MNLRLITFFLQFIVAAIPLKMQYDMGHRIGYSIKTYGFFWEVIWLLIILGPPTAALWSTYCFARRRSTQTAVVVSYAVGLVGVTVLTLFSVLLVGISGMR